VPIGAGGTVRNRRRSFSEQSENCARIVLFQAMLREAYGAITVLWHDPLGVMERTRPRAEELLGPLAYPLAEA